MRHLFIGSILAVFTLAVSLVAVSPQSVHADPRDFTLVNGSSVVISYVYVSSADTSDWEEDVMGQDVLGPGDSVNISFSGFTEGDCSYDIKVVGAGGEEGYMYGVNLCSTSTVTFSD